MSDPGAATIAIVIVGMAALNFAMRFAPMALLSRRRLPKPVMRWLSYIPISVMGALVAIEVMRPQGEWQAPLGNPGLYAAILTMIVFRFSRSFLGATVAGMVSFVAIRALLG